MRRPASTFTPSVSLFRYGDATSVGWFRNLQQAGATPAFDSTPTVVFVGVNLPSVGLNVLWITPVLNK